MQKAMVTLSDYKKQLRGQFTNRNVINLSKYSFTKGQHNLLNENLNFVQLGILYKNLYEENKTKRLFL